MNKNKISKVIADASRKYRTPASLIMNLNRPADIIASPPTICRSESIGSGLALGWRDLRSMHFLIELGVGLDSLITSKKGNLRDKQIDDACRVVLSELRNLEKQGATCRELAYSGVLAFLSKYGKHRIVLDLGDAMKKEKIKITDKSLWHILSSAVHSQPEKVFSYWKTFETTLGIAYRPDYVAFLILAKKELGDEEAAFSIYKKFRNDGLTSSITLFEAILSCSSSLRRTRLIINQMNHSDTKYTPKCLRSVIATCTSDSNIIFAETFWSEFIKTGGIPCGYCCRAMFVLYMKHNKVKEAREFVSSISDKKKKNKINTLVREAFYVLAIRDMCAIMSGQNQSDRAESFQISGEYFRYGLALSDRLSKKRYLSRAPSLFSAMFVAATFSDAREVSFILRDEMIRRRIPPNNDVQNSFKKLTGKQFFDEES